MNALQRIAFVAEKLDKMGLHDIATELDSILLVAAKKNDVDGHKSPPKEYREEGATSRSDYADPDNYKYPIHTEENVRAAISYFSQPDNAGRYPVSKQKEIWKRITDAAKKYNIELSDKSGPPSVEKK